jgi:hypothetical protein
VPCSTNAAPWRWSRSNAWVIAPPLAADEWVLDWPLLDDEAMMLDEVRRRLALR